MKDSSIKKQLPQSGAENTIFLENGELHILTDREIEERKIDLHQLWFMLIKEEPLGPIEQQELIRFLEEHPSFPRDTKVSSFKNPLWLPIYRYPVFQRKQASEKQEDGQPAKEFYLLHNGSKKGPYSLLTLEKMIDENRCLPFHLVCEADGKQWMKAYEMSEIKDFFGQKSLKDLPTHLKDSPPPESRPYVLPNSKTSEKIVWGLALLNKFFKESTPFILEVEEDDENDKPHQIVLQSKGTTEFKKIDIVPKKSSYSLSKILKIVLPLGTISLGLYFAVQKFNEGSSSSSNPTAHSASSKKLAKKNSEGREKKLLMEKKFAPVPEARVQRSPAQASSAPHQDHPIYNKEVPAAEKEIEDPEIYPEDSPENYPEELGDTQEDDLPQFGQEAYPPPAPEGNKEPVLPPEPEYELH